jgi:heme exporter protein C
MAHTKAQLTANSQSAVKTHSRARLRSGLTWGLFVLMTAAIVAVFLTPSPMSKAAALVTGDLSVDPAKIYRIMYFHVPQAITATVAFLMAMFFAVRYLMSRSIDNDSKSFRANQAGMLFAILALITGSIFARYTWGFWWDWGEIRMTSMFIMTLMYGGYFALRSSIPDTEKRATLSAVMSILFGIAAIFLMFVAPRIAATRHPTDSIVDESGDPMMSALVGAIFVSFVVAYVGLYLWIWGMSVRLSRVEQRRAEGEIAESGITPLVEDVNVGS